MRLLVLALFGAVLLGGCAANVPKDAGRVPLKVGKDSSQAVVLNLDGSSVATQAKDWEPFKGEWRSAMSAAAAAAGVRYAEQTGAPHATGEPGTLVAIYVDDYRYISPGARFGFGIMTGNAFVDAKATFTDLQGGDALGERRYNTSSSAWQGIFSAMTGKQIEAICKEIVGEVSGKGTGADNRR